MQENWINKIVEHQTTPPQGLWHNIASQLDNEDEHLDNLKLKLLSYETAVPGVVFKNVFDQLDKDEGKIYPITKNRQKRTTVFIRIAVAASLVTIALLLFFNNKKTADTDKAVATAPVNQPASKTPAAGIMPAATIPAPGINKKNDGEKIAGIPVQKTNPLQAAVNYTRAKHAVNEELNLPAYPGNIAKLQSAQQLMPVSSKLINALNRYITITGPGGESVKLSSKFGSIPGILNNGNAGLEANDIDAVINESSKWSTTFAGWRNKMAGNIITPSLINFLDIVELSEFLEEKKLTISQLDLRYLNLY